MVKTIIGNIDYKYFFCGLIFFVISMIIFVILAFLEWSCVPPLCSICEDLADPCNPFCEELKIGEIKQPFSTFSNMSLVISGLIILILIGKKRNIAENGPNNPLIKPSFYSVTYAFLAIFIGIGSTIYHASLTSYGGFLDTYAMVLYVAFLIVYDIIRLTKQTEKLFIALYVPIVVIFAVIMNLGFISGVDLFTILVFVAFSIEVFLLLASYRLDSFKWIHRDWKWFVAGFGSFLIGFAIWIPTNKGGIFCDPYSWIQGHAFWHILVGLATYLLYVYARSEIVKSD